MPMNASETKEPESFSFVQALRERIDAQVDRKVWEIMGQEGSLSIYFKPFAKVIGRVLGDVVDVKAQYWANNAPRVAFEFWSPSSQHPELCQSLASSFRDYLLRRGIPEYCRTSRNATVLHVPRNQVADVKSLGKATGLFGFIHKNIDHWRQEHLASLLEAAKPTLSFTGGVMDVLAANSAHHAKDALDDLENYRSSYEDLPATERDAVRKSRIGQGRFRNELIQYWEGCAVTGITVRSVLRASHIKPWRDSDNQERLDRYNGLLLAPNLDALFDAGLISFTDAGRIVLSSKLSNNERSLLGVDDNLALRMVEEPHWKYLHFHRNYHGLDH